MTPTQDLPPNLFKRNLAAGKPQIGLWLVLESVAATEMLVGCGADWLLLDMEHTTLDAGDVVQHLRAARAGSAEIVVRIPTNEPVMVKRLLDAGVRSFMFPMVNSAEEARRAVASTLYPPAGIRGIAGSTRGSGFGRIPSYLHTAHQEQCVIVQIESASALDAIGEIGAVDGVDGLFVGPNDLAANLGFLGQPGGPEARQAVALALDRIRSTGKAPGILNFVPSEARALLAAGYQFIAVGSDASVLVRRSEALVQEIRSGS